MSDEGEKTCPLCAEEMDLTDQQLKPCKCGYDICVWCWHHIMDMAEKDDTEGRCPACRTPYNKEKIVGTASKCERLMAEMNVEKKQKSQKGKTKTSEGRKQLTSVRVIQRNLVYIVGLPLNLADEDLLQRKEYFGQYGKVQKVSISRTAAGAIQHFPNNTCSVYITYSKEDEAVRSIQSVHGFLLEGRPLRACFGTTKYCHAWLRNMPCTNPDCLYLHEFGSQEDSFTKDETISEYTRGRVQQVTGATNEMQRRSGNFLPPPTDDPSNNTPSPWAKPITKTTTNDSTNSMKGSPPNSSSGRSIALPAAASWGTRASNSQSPAANIPTSNGPSKQKADPSISTPIVSPSSNGNEMLKKHLEENPTTDRKDKVEYPKQNVGPDISASTSPNNKNNYISMVDPALEKDPDEERINKLSSDMTSLTINRNHGCDSEKLLEPLSSIKAKMAVDVSRNKVQEVASSEAEADLLSFNNQRLRDPEVVTQTGYVQNMSHSQSLNSINTSSYSSYGSVNGSLGSSHVNQNLEKGYSHVNQNFEKGYTHVNQNFEKGSVPNTFNMPVANGHTSNLDHSSRFEGSNGHSYSNNALDLGENSIISNILSMDFDPWDESLTSPRNLAKILGDGDKQQGSQRVSGSSRKTQNCNQSRFSFAREDEYVDQGSKFAPSLSDFGHRNISHDFLGNGDVYQNGQLSDSNGFSRFNFEESDHNAANHTYLSSNKNSVSRSQISAPPGFLGPSRAPPPGFTSNERIEQTYENLSGNHMYESSAIMRKMHHQAAAAPVYNNGSIGDLEFMDPAILAVGGRVPSGGLSNFPSTQHSSFENDNRLRLLMQRSFSPQNQRFSELTDNNNNFGYGNVNSSRLVEHGNNRSLYHHHQQQQQGNLSSFQHGTRSSSVHWGDGWNNNEVENGNDIAMAELLRNERLGFSKYYSDSKLRFPSSGDLYNRTFGI